MFSTATQLSSLHQMLFFTYCCCIWPHQKKLAGVVCWHWLWLFMKYVPCIVLFIPFPDTKRISINCCHFQVEFLSLESWIETKSDLKISKLCLHTTRNFSSSVLFVSVINNKQFSIVCLLRLLLKNWSISPNHCQRDHNIFARIANNKI